jgi:hypothetical protein
MKFVVKECLSVRLPDFLRGWGQPGRSLARRAANWIFFGNGLVRIAAARGYRKRRQIGEWLDISELSHEIAACAPTTAARRW